MSAISLISTTSEGSTIESVGYFLFFRIVFVALFVDPQKDTGDHFIFSILLARSSDQLKLLETPPLVLAAFSKSAPSV